MVRGIQGARRGKRRKCPSITQFRKDKAITGSLTFLGILQRQGHGNPGHAQLAIRQLQLLCGRTLTIAPMAQIHAAGGRVGSGAAGGSTTRRSRCSAMPLIVRFQEYITFLKVSASFAMENALPSYRLGGLGGIHGCGAQKPLLQRGVVMGYYSDVALLLGREADGRA